MALPHHVDHYCGHHSSRVRAMMASVLMAMSPRPRRWATRRAPQLGCRPAVGARALYDREIREEAGHRDEPPEDHQSLLHAIERRRPGGEAMEVLAPGIGEIIGGSQRGSTRSLGPQYGRTRHRPRALPHPSRRATASGGGLRRGDPRRYGTGAPRRLQANPRLRDRPCQPPRRHPLAANAGECAALMRAT